MSQINPERLWKDVMKLSEFTEPGLPWTRRSFTNKYNEGREWLKKRMLEAGLELEVDAAANVIGKRFGTNPELPPIVIGSHTDTVPNGGRFDGIAGVLVGLEVLRTLDENGVLLEHAIELVDFTSEEPSVYGLSTIGSRAWSGNLTEKMLGYTNDVGETLATAIHYAGGNPELIETVKRNPGEVALYLELHIEQGPVLLEQKSKLGVVSGIVGINRFQVNVSGVSNHAGTTPMHLRSDALTGACEMILGIEKITSKLYSTPLVGTVGELNNFPNASNVIPGEVEFIFEIRSLSKDLLNEISESIITEIKVIAANRKLAIKIEPISNTESIIMNKSVKSLLFNACKDVTPAVIELPSGAGHDANQLALICPVGMLFIPCKDGRSHCPEEWSEESDLAMGANAILRAIQDFSNQSK